MLKKFTINSKDYTFKNIDFNGICELEDLGVDLASMKSKSFSAIRGLLAYHGNMTVEQAGAEIMSHIANGGSFDDFAPMFNHFSDCDFFRQLSKPSIQAEVIKGKN